VDRPGRGLEKLPKLRGALSRHGGRLARWGCARRVPALRRKGCRW
jgi:hypothetical protein